MKKGYKGSITDGVTQNTNFRNVLYTGSQLQLVAMTLQPNEDIGEEDHDGHDQFFHIVSGTGEVKINETLYQVAAGDLIVIPSGALHNVTNTSDTEVLQVYTMYAPPEHQDKLVNATKPQESTPHFDGTTTE